MVYKEEYYERDYEWAKQSPSPSSVEINTSYRRKNTDIGIIN